MKNLHFNLLIPKRLLTKSTKKNTYGTLNGRYYVLYFKRQVLELFSRSYKETLIQGKLILKKKIKSKLPKQTQKLQNFEKENKCYFFQFIMSKNILSYMD